MKGSEFVRIIERELATQGLSKAEFYKNCNLSSATLSNWRNNVNQPTLRNIQIVSDYLGISLEEDEPTQDESDLAETLEAMRTRPELKLLFETLKDAPPSYVYQVLSEVSKYKEGNE